MSEPKRKLTFQRDEGLGKLKLRFEDGELTLALSKHRSAHTLTREQAQELALWLSAWSLKLIDDATKASAAEESRAELPGVEDAGGAKKDPHQARRSDDEKRKKKSKRKGEKRERKKDVKVDARHGGGEEPARDARKRDRDPAS